MASTLVPGAEPDAVVFDDQAELVVDLHDHPDRAGVRVAGGVGEGFAERGHEVFDDGVGHRLQRAIEGQFRGEAERRLLSVDHVDHPSAHAGGVEVVHGEAEDRLTDLADGLVQLVHHLEDPGAGEDVTLRSGQLERHSRREQALDDRVVQVTGDALPVLEHPQLLFGGAQLAFGLQTLGHVPAAGHDLPVTVGVGDLRALQDALDVQLGAVLAAVTRGDGPAGHPPGEERLDQGPVVLFGHRGIEVQDRHALHVGSGLSDLLGAALVDVVEQERVGVEDVDALARAVQGPLDLVDAPLGLDPFGHVADDGDHTGAFLTEVDRGQRDLDREPAPVRTDRAEVEAGAHRPRPGLAVIGRAVGPVELSCVWWHEVVDGDLVEVGDAEELPGPVVGGGDLPVATDHQNGVGGEVEDGLGQGRIDRGGRVGGVLLG